MLKKHTILRYIISGLFVLGIMLTLGVGAVFAAENPYACANHPEIPTEVSTGTCVQALQWLLNTKMPELTPKLNEDGDYGPATKARILAWQQKNNLRCKEGIAGPETWNSLIPGLGKTGRCVDVGGNTNTNTQPTGPSAECKKLEQNFNEFAGGTPGPLANNCYSPGQAVNRAITILFTLVAILAVLFVVIGGYRYIMSAGDEKKAASGKSTIKWALLGLALVFFAYMIVRIVRSLIAG